MPFYPNTFTLSVPGMLYVLTHDILPIFSMLALGYVLGRVNTVSNAEAATLNRIAFLVLQPALIFPLIAGLDWSTFRADAIGLYALCQVVVFVLAYQLCRRVLKRDLLEAWFLAMATIFVNTLLYIWPISFLIYGEVAASPITGVVAWDASVTFAFFIVSTELLANRNASVKQSLTKIATNPILIAIASGTLLSLLAISIPQPFLTAMTFAGAGAAPLTLFALGVVLSGHSLRMSPTIATISALKLLAFPALVWGALHVGDRPETWNTLLVLAAAGPSGAMAFALALLHGVRTDQIAPVVIWTSVLSLMSLAWLA